MKTLHITHWFPTGRNPQSGCFIADQCHTIHHNAPDDAQILYVDIEKSSRWLPKVCVSSRSTEKGLRLWDFRIYWILAPLLYVYPQLQWKLFNRRILHILNEFEPDLIHGHVVHPSGALAWKTASVASIPFVITEHWSNLHRYFRNRVSSSWGRMAYQEARYILPVSGYLGDLVKSLGFAVEPGKVMTVPNVVDPGVFYYKEHKKTAGVVHFIMVSTWSRYKQVTKRPELLIKAVAAFSDSHNERVKLTVVGGGNLLPNMKSLARKMGLDATFTGSLPRQQIAELLRQADFFLHASNIETFSLVTAEALMCGLPAVVSNTGALPYLVTRSRGVACENTVEAWKDALQVVVSSPYNRKQISEEITQFCSPEAVSETIRGLYEDIKGAAHKSYVD